MDLLSAAWLDITRHRLRSLLAVLGVGIGVCALTSIMSVEKSWQNAVMKFFSAMDLETVQVSVPVYPGWRESGYSRGTVNREDAQAMEQECPVVQSATLMEWALARVETEDGSALDLAVRGVYPDFTRTLPDKLREGRFFAAADNSARSRVCLLSYEARLWLFGEEPAVGRYIRIEGNKFQVVGIISGNLHYGVGGRDIYVPAAWAHRQLRSWTGGTPDCEVFVHTQDPKAAIAQIDGLMRRRIGGDASDRFASSLWRAREAALHARARATLYSGLAGLCALLAAGIGIAAVLFVSVAERAREIGICRALGASRGRIYGEYLLAAAMLSAIGGVLGAVAGIPAAMVGAFASRWQPVLGPASGEMLIEGRTLPKLSEIALAVSWEAMVIALVLALLTGLVAALAPASEAAGINPAQAIAQRGGSRGRLRRVLTALQVAFGVVVLIVLTSYFAAMQSEETADARRMLGQDRIAALADPIGAMRKPVPRRYRDACKQALARVLTSPENIAQLKRRTPLLTALAPVVPEYFSIESGGQVDRLLQVNFTTADALMAYEPEIKGEQAVAVAEAFRSGAPVVVISPGMQEKFFGERDAVGKSLSIGGRKFRIVAVRPARYSTGLREAWAPIAWYEKMRPRANNLGFFGQEARLDARPLDPRRYTEAAKQLHDALLPLLPAEYRKSIKMSEQIPETTRQFIFQHQAVAVRGAVGALAVLLVALIGLANMLLVSVHDELREVGLRRALGALRSDVLWHFLSEGVLLSVLGVVGGVLAGSAVCWLTKSQADLPISVSIFWVAAGAVATITAGAVISLFPALAAARIHPVEALRYE